MAGLRNDLVIESVAAHFVHNVTRPSIDHSLQVMQRTFKARDAGILAHLQAPHTP